MAGGHLAIYRKFDFKRLVTSCRFFARSNIEPSDHIAKYRLSRHFFFHLLKTSTTCRYEDFAVKVLCYWQ